MDRIPVITRYVASHVDKGVFLGATKAVGVIWSNNPNGILSAFTFATPDEIILFFKKTPELFDLLKDLNIIPVYPDKFVDNTFFASAFACKRSGLPGWCVQ